MSRWTDTILRRAERRRIRRETELAIRTMTCRFCQAKPGEHCHGPRGRVYLPSTPAHYERRVDAVRLSRLKPQEPT